MCVSLSTAAAATAYRKSARGSARLVLGGELARATRRVPWGWKSASGLNAAGAADGARCSRCRRVGASKQRGKSTSVDEAGAMRVYTVSTFFRWKEKLLDSEVEIFRMTQKCLTLFVKNVYDSENEKPFGEKSWVFIAPVSLWFY